ncbi:MAG: GNAT family N-acetyltransferase [Bacteroidaceae bacterium]
MKLTEITAYSEKVHELVEQFLSQLSSTPHPISEAYLKEIIESSNSFLLFLECKTTPIGMLTISIHLAPTGRKVWIEDVVIDKAYRGKGYGKELLEKAIVFAQERGLTSFLLTSRPSRKAANALYRSLGFEQKETNCYVMK